jgi:hypothetical protein
MITSSFRKPGRLSDPGQLTVFNPVRLIGSGPETGSPVRFIFRVVSFKPDDTAVTLEGKDMGGNAIQKPAVVTDDDSAAGEIFQGFFQGAHRVDIQVVGWFVKKKDVGAFFEHPRQVNAIPFAAGESPTLFC